MPLDLIERSFLQGLSIPLDDENWKAVAGVVVANAERGGSWVHSYLSPERTQTFCRYDAPTPEAIRKVAERNGLAVRSLIEVSVLRPNFCRP